MRTVVKHIHFVNTLSVYVLLLIILKTLSSQRSQVCCCVITVTPLARFIAQRWGIQVAVIDYRLSQLKDNKGSNVWVLMVYQYLQEYLNNLGINDQSCLGDYLRKQAGLYEEPLIYSFVLKNYAFTQHKDAQLHCWVKYRFELAGWVPILRHLGVVVYGYQRYWFYVRYTASIASAVLKHIMVALRELLFSFSLQKAESIKESSIAVDYYGHLNLDDRQKYSDLFFLDNLSINLKNHVVLLFRLGKDKLDEAKKKLLDKHGVSVLVLSTQASQMPIAYARFFKIVKVSFKRILELKFSHLKEGLTFLIMKGCWERFLDKYRIDIMVGWNKYDQWHIPLAQVLRQRQGLMCFYQRAFEELPSIRTMAVGDIFFCYSSLSAKLYRSMSGENGCYVITGYLGDHRFKGLKIEGNKIKQQLQSAGATHVVAYFDENTADNYRQSFGHHEMRADYQGLLERVLSDSTFGLVLKPKVASNLARRLGDVNKLLKQAIATQRCYLFEDGAIQNGYPPAIAAYGADLAIHGHLYAATAGVESALAGVPTVLLDREGFHQSCLYQLGEKRVVFRNWNDFWKEYEKIKGIKNQQQIGNWSLMKSVIDPFNDGQAVVRMDEFLSVLYQGYAEGKNKKEAIYLAVSNYIQKWGPESVLYYRND